MTLWSMAMAVGSLPTTERVSDKSLPAPRPSGFRTSPAGYGRRAFRLRHRTGEGEEVGTSDCAAAARIVPGEGTPVSARRARILAASLVFAALTASLLFAAGD